MRHRLAAVLGKIVARLVKLRGGGGSAFPGLVVERLDPGFLGHVLGNIPRGVAVVSGTNGKTTTTKIVVQLLRASGLKVFTNRTGSNFTRGVVSELLPVVRGVRLDADIAVLELDEAHAVHFVEQVQPNNVLLLNVLRDQLDRFGEIDKTASLLETVARHAKRGVTLNREDPLVARIASRLDPGIAVSWFGYAPDLARLFPNDDQLYTTDAQVAEPAGAEQAADTELVQVAGHRAGYLFAGQPEPFTANLQLSGSHNMLNAAAALALVRQILGERADAGRLISTLEQVKPAFGRGETMNVGGDPLELILVKNPSGFRSALASQLEPGTATMIAINDQYADGRDMSWLWDVDFSGLSEVAMVSGIRAFDMALRLHYDNIPVQMVETDLDRGIAGFLSAAQGRPKQIFCTYTAMLQIRRNLGNRTRIEAVL